MIIQVTAKHILKGVPNRSDACPVALALREITGSTWWVMRRGGEMLAASADGHFKFSNEVNRWIQYYDSGGVPAPIAFEMI